MSNKEPNRPLRKILVLLALLQLKERSTHRLTDLLCSSAVDVMKLFGSEGGELRK